MSRPLARALAAAAGIAAFALAPAARAQTPLPGTVMRQTPPLGAHPRIPSKLGRASTLDYTSGMPLAAPAPAAPRQARLVADGRALYDTHCSSCHGANLRGVAARETELSSTGTGGPTLARDGGSGVDFYLTTGRMPLAVTNTQAVHDQPHFDPPQIAALDAFVGTQTTVVAVPHVRLDRALLQRGRLLFEDNCQACHGAGAEGATAGEQWIALPLDQATPTQIGEAIRVGPGVMPRWNARQFDDRDISAIATFVRYQIETPQDFGGTTLAYLGPVAEGVVGGIAGVGALFWVIYFTGTKADGSRLSER